MNVANDDKRRKNAKSNKSVNVFESLFSPLLGVSFHGRALEEREKEEESKRRKRDNFLVIRMEMRRMRKEMEQNQKKMRREYQVYQK